MEVDDGCFVNWRIQGEQFFDTSYELIGYVNKLNKSYEMFAVGNKNNLPKIKEKLYLADTEKYYEYNPEVHKKLIVELVKKIIN